jgi:hypothetical protein
VRELADSTALQSDQAALRQRLAADGYLFFRRLLRPADVSAAYDSVRAELALGGWTDRDGHPAGPQRAVNVRDALADPSFRAALASRGLNRLAYLPPLRGAVRLILGPGAFSYPVKVLRTVYPESPAAITRGRYIHQDFAVSGVHHLAAADGYPGTARRPGRAARKSSRPAAAAAAAARGCAGLGNHRLPAR